MGSLLTLDLKTDFEAFRAQLNDIEKKQLPYAARRALFLTAKDVKGRLEAAVPEIFTKATPFTKRAIGAKGPTSSFDPLVAEVFVLTLQAQYLGLEEEGGGRTPSSNTRRPGATALVLPNKAFVENPFTGNIPYGGLAKLQRMAAADLAKRRRLRAALAKLSKLKRDGAQRKLGSAQEKFRNMRGTTGVVFLAAGSAPARFGKIGGYFERGGTADKHTIRRLTTFKGATHYQPKFGFRKKFEAFASAAFTLHMQEELIKALQSGR
jgi:hypothetical protein